MKIPHRTSWFGTIFTAIQFAVVLACGDAYSGSATWSSSPPTADWNTATNWAPNTVPNSPTDVATFDISDTKRVSFSATTEVDSIIFNPGANPYTITNTPFHPVTISGAGVINNSGVTQTFISDMGSGIPSDQADSPAFPGIQFENSAIAGSNTAFITFGGNSELGVGGNVDFFNSSSADHATFDIYGSSGEAYTSELGFSGSSTAANATIRIHRNGFLRVDGFGASPPPTLGSAIVTNTEGSVTISSGATVDQATIINIGHRQFFTTSMTVSGSTTGTSTLATATVINQGGAGALGRGACLLSSFSGASCTAASAMIMNTGGDGGGKLGGAVTFGSGSTAENATLVADPGSNGARGGEIIFLGSSLGGASRCELFGNGSLDISQHDAPGLTVGSVEGGGLIFLGSLNLTLGSNNLSTLFFGNVQDSGIAGGTGGSLTKLGAATLTLSGANTYTGGTTVSEGSLVISNSRDSGTGTGPVSVLAGTLGGGGTIAGAVTVGSGNGAGAFLAPAAGSPKQATLTLQGSLTLNSDATFTYTFKAKQTRSKTDLVIANGVTISGAAIALQGTTQGLLIQGTVYIVISNTSVDPISGTFGNLAEGAIVNVNGNNLQASYTGGDGNDLTLTVVP